VTVGIQDDGSYPAVYVINTVVKLQPTKCIGRIHSHTIRCNSIAICRPMSMQSTVTSSMCTGIGSRQFCRGRGRGQGREVEAEARQGRGRVKSTLFVSF